MTPITFYGTKIFMLNCCLTWHRMTKTRKKRLNCLTRRLVLKILLKRNIPNLLLTLQSVSLLSEHLTLWLLVKRGRYFGNRAVSLFAILLLTLEKFRE